MNKWLELFLGFLLLLAPIALALYNLWGFGSATLTFLKGGIVVFVALVGVMFIMLGISDITA